MGICASQEIPAQFETAGGVTIEAPIYRTIASLADRSLVDYVAVEHELRNHMCKPLHPLTASFQPGLLSLSMAEDLEWFLKLMMLILLELFMISAFLWCSSCAR